MASGRALLIGLVMVAIASSSSAFAEKAQTLGIDAKGNAPAELDAWTRSEIVRWAEVAKAAHQRGLTSLKPVFDSQPRHGRPCPGHPRLAY